MNPKNLFLLFSLFFSFIYLPAQQSVLYFHELNSQGKLSQTTNEFVFRDSRGFIWISSNDGLNRYDGLNVEVYKPGKKPNSILGNNIQSNFFEDKQGRIWFSTYEAINCYRPSSNDFASLQLTIHGDTLDSEYHIFHYDQAKDLLWLKIRNAIYTYNFKNKIFSETMAKGPFGFRFLVAENKKTGQVESVINWSFGGALLKEVYSSTMNSAPVLDFKPEKVQKVLLQSADSLWVLTDKQLYRVVRQNQGAFVPQAVPLGDLPPEQLPLSMTFLKPGFLLFWLPEGGLASYNLRVDRIQRRWHAHAFNPPVRSELMGRNMYLDTYANIWLSIPGLGLRYANLNRKIFEYIPLSPLSNGREKSAITAMQLLPNGQIILADRNKGILIFSSAKGLSSPQNAELLLNNEVYAILPDSTDRAFLFTFKEIYLYEAAPHRITKVGENTSFIFSTSRLNNGQVLASAYFPLKLRFWQPKQLKFSEPIRGIPFPEHKIKDVFQDRKDRVYLPYNDEFILVGTLLKDSFALRKKIAIKGTVNGHFDDPRTGKMWVATTHDLFVIDQKNLQWNTVDAVGQGTQQATSSLVADLKGALWLGSNNGLYYFDPQKKRNKHYKVTEGLPDIEFRLKGAANDSKGKVLMATRNGLIYFDPLNTPGLIDTPKIVLLKYMASNGPKDNLQLVFNQKKISRPFNSSLYFHFQGIEYSNPVEVQLQYRLWPLEKEWITVSNGDGKIRYTELRAGNYTFEARAISADSVYSDQPLHIPVKIAKPYWETTGFRLVAILIILIAATAVGWFIAQQRIKKQKQKQQTIEEERNRMMEDLHDGIGFDLTAIKAISEKSIITSKDQVFRQQFEKVFIRSQDAMRTMTEISRATDDQYNSLEAFVEWVKEKVEIFIADMEISPDIQNNIPKQGSGVKIGAEARQNLWLVIKETLNNMAKHSGTDRISLWFSLHHNVIHIHLQDYGKGFDLDTTKLGRGMRNMPKRMKNINGSFELQSSETGTIVKLSLPIISYQNIGKQFFYSLKKYLKQD